MRGGKKESKQTDDPQKGQGCQFEAWARTLLVFLPEATGEGGTENAEEVWGERKKKVKGLVGQKKRQLETPSYTRRRLGIGSSGRGLGGKKDLREGPGGGGRDS